MINPEDVDPEIEKQMHTDAGIPCPWCGGSLSEWERVTDGICEDCWLSTK